MIINNGQLTIDNSNWQLLDEWQRYEKAFQMQIKEKELTNCR